MNLKQKKLDLIFSMNIYKHTFHKSIEIVAVIIITTIIIAYTSHTYRHSHASLPANKVIHSKKFVFKNSQLHIKKMLTDWQYTHTN